MKTLGIWIGFDHKLPIKREGWARVIFYLVKHLLKNYPISCEVWCYSYNYKEVEILFSELLGDRENSRRLRVITEKDFDEGEISRRRVFRRGMEIVKNIILYDRGISWKDPYRYYRSYYPLRVRRRREIEGEGFSIKEYIKYFLIDLICSVVMVFGGLIGRVLRRTILRINLPRVTEKCEEFVAKELPGEVGEVDGVERVAREDRDSEGNIIYGPYVKLSAGYHEVELHYSYKGEGRGDTPIWDVIFHRGEGVEVVAGGELRVGDDVMVGSFYVTEENAGKPMEFRVWYKGKGELRVKKVIIRREVRMEEGGGERDMLAKLANKYSSADCFLIPIVTLGNGLELNFPELVILHDLVTLEFYDYFINENPKWKEWIEYGKRCAEDYGRKGVIFCGISKYVIHNQLLRFIKTVNEEQTDFAYHASMKPDKIFERLLSKDTILKKFGIRHKYIFYPTQIRPYKNLITLLKAFKLLLEKEIEIQLVLTGTFEYDKNSKDYLEKNRLNDHIVFTGDLTETELYSLYFYADVVVVTSLFEGGFPLQALEAIAMNAPVVIARIPVTIERLLAEGFNPEACGLKLFNPEDENELCLKIQEVLHNRERAILEQKFVKDKFAQYTWDDVSRKYYALLSKICGK